MTDTREAQDLLYQRLTQSLQTNQGATPPLLRQKLVEHATQTPLAEETRFLPEEGLPPDLQTYITKVRRHAYKVTDEDIQRLHNAGYSEDAIFEITLCTALGAGTRCLTNGLTALAELERLEGANDATTHD